MSGEYDSSKPITNFRNKLQQTTSNHKKWNVKIIGFFYDP